MNIPRRCIEVIRKFGLDKKRVLDCGCGNVVHLPFWGDSSVGLDLQNKYTKIGLSKKIDVRKCNLEEEYEWPVEKESFDAVWSSAYLEHSLSPHTFLIKARRYIKPNGFIAISVPVVQLTSFRRKVGKMLRFWRGAYASDHVNFFTEYTIKETIKRAGFKNVKSYVSLFESPFISGIMQWILRPFWFNVVVVGEKISSWDYPEKAHKKYRDGQIVFKD